MSETDELMRLLEKHGVEYETFMDIKNRYVEATSDTEHSAICTPEQAIIATLGGGECELVEVDSYSSDRETIHVLECSACGKTCEHVNGSYPKCPHCGRRAVNGLAVSVTNDIKLCPWCGGEADLVETETKCDGMKFWKVSCNDYHCMGANIHMWHKTESEAIEAWNTRMLGDEDCEDDPCSKSPSQLFKLPCGHSFMLYGLGVPVTCPVCGKAVKQR